MRRRVLLQKNAVSLLNKTSSKNVKRKFSAKQINKKNKRKNTTINVTEKYEINVKMRWSKKSKLKIKFKLPVFYSVEQNEGLIYEKYKEKFCDKIAKTFTKQIKLNKPF